MFLLARPAAIRNATRRRQLRTRSIATQSSGPTRFVRLIHASTTKQSRSLPGTASIGANRLMMKNWKCGSQLWKMKIHHSSSSRTWPSGRLSLSQRKRHVKKLRLGSKPMAVSIPSPPGIRTLSHSAYLKDRIVEKVQLPSITSILTIPATLGQSSI